MSAIAHPPGPRGIVCPVATPLTDDEELEVDGFNALLDRILPVVHGVFVLGSSGELAILTSDVAEQVVDHAVERVNGRSPVYVGIGDTSTRRTIANAARFGRIAADYFVVCPPYYYPVDQASLARHFLSVAEAVDRPIVLYNIPQNTGVSIAPDTVAALSEHPNIVGMKDSAGDMLLFERYLEFRTESFTVLQGREQLAAASLWRGADGVISALSNLAPTLLSDLWTAVERDDTPRASALQRKINAAAVLFDEGYWLSALQAALAISGIGNGRPIAPLPPCTDDQREAIRRLLEQHILTEARHGRP